MSRRGPPRAALELISATVGVEFEEKAFVASLRKTAKHAPCVRVARALGTVVAGFASMVTSSSAEALVDTEMPLVSSAGPEKANETTPESRALVREVNAAVAELSTATAGALPLVDAFARAEAADATVGNGNSGENDRKNEAVTLRSTRKNEAVVFNPRRIATEGDPRAGNASETRASTVSLMGSAETAARTTGLVEFGRESRTTATVRDAASVTVVPSAMLAAKVSRPSSRHSGGGMPILAAAGFCAAGSIVETRCSTPPGQAALRPHFLQPRQSELATSFSDPRRSAIIAPVCT